jgi:long-chain acyl-CoA synthetase
MEMAEAVGLISGERHMTWAAFDRRVLQAAGGLKALGIGEGDTVALLLRNDSAFMEASLGATRRGAYAVPINWHFKSQEVAYVLTDCAARVLVVHADLWRQVREAIPPGVTVLMVATPPEVRAAFRIADADGAVPEGALEWEAWLADQAPLDEPPLPPCESMIYTSGTTGQPKGVRRFRPTPEQAREMERLRGLVYGIESGMRALVPGPLYHSAPNSYGLRAARMGGLMVLMPRFDAEELLRLVERHRIGHLLMVPTMFVRLLNLPETVRRRYDVSSIKFVVHAAAPCPPDVKAAMIEWWGPVITEFYGGTESGAVTFCDSADWLAHRGTVGRVIEGVVVKALDDDGREVAPGTPGELYMRILAYPEFTYQNRPEERRRIDRDGLLTLGDVGYFDNSGYLYLCDRKRDMIISGGVNIYPAEIEAAIHTLPGVRDCAVFGIPDAEFGEQIMAVVEPDNGATLTPDAIVAHVRTSLADYKVPRRVEIRHGLPREDSGKIRKRALREPYWEGAGRRI